MPQNEEGPLVLHSLGGYPYGVRALKHGEIHEELWGGYPDFVAAIEKQKELLRDEDYYQWATVVKIETPAASAWQEARGRRP